MALVQPILERFGKDSIALISAELDKRGFRGKPTRASGKTERELSFEADEELFILFGPGHIFMLEFGRGPSKGAGQGESLKDRIRHWIDDKGIKPDGISKDSLAFLIARKIHREGTLLYQTKQQSGILSNVINEQRINQLAQELLEPFSANVVSTLIADLKTIEVWTG